MKLAASFDPLQGQPAARLLSVASRVRNALMRAEKPQFVSAFCQSNCGDVSPNVLGAFCIDSGLPCDFNHSTCNGKNELCYGRGPGYLLIWIFNLIFYYCFSITFLFIDSYPDEFESTRIIGERQFKKAVELFTKANEQLKGKIGFRHSYIDFSKVEVSLTKAGGGIAQVKTCPAAMGFAFAAGTTDGPGAFDFKQGDNKVSHKLLVTA